MKVSQLEKKDFINLDGNIYQVIDIKHTHLGRGKANVLLVLKELRSGKKVEKNFKSDEDVELVEIEEREIVFDGVRGDEMNFKDEEDKKYVLKTKDFKHLLPFLVNGNKYSGLFFEDELVAVSLPKVVYLKVISAPPGIKGNTVQATTKIVKVENGYQFKVPLFINEGDTIAINTESGEYIERVQK
jgi:elongation factor P